MSIKLRIIASTAEFVLSESEMSKTPGMLSLEELSEKVSAGEIDTVLVAFPDLYGRLMGKRNDAGFFL